MKKSILSRDLCGVLAAWRYAAEETDQPSPVEQLASGVQFSDVTVMYFQGEKWGDDERLWRVLAPFIEDGGAVEMTGEDSTLWRYRFEGGNLIEETGTIVWS